MGLFDVFRTKPKTSTNMPNAVDQKIDSIMVNYQENKKQQDNQNKLLAQVNAARAKYKKDGDLDAVIAVFEDAFWKADPPCTSSQSIDLVGFYLKAGQNDKAWAYLSYLYHQWMNDYAAGKASLYDAYPIRDQQARIVKKEKRYAYAIGLYMQAHLLKSSWNDTFQKELFLKAIQPCVNKLQWEADVPEYLAYLIGNAVSNKRYDEGNLIDQYKKFLSEIGFDSSELGSQS